jgi:hypothetical protein
MDTPAAAEPEQPDDANRDDEQPAPVTPVTSAPLLPSQSREDTDVGWGDYGDRDDYERLLRDRPPHWGNG